MNKGHDDDEEGDGQSAGSESVEWRDSMPSADVVVQHIIAVFGGMDAARKAVENEFDEAEERWHRDVDKIGRILRAHLFVEHYLAEYISGKNAHLGPLRRARLSFAQKVELVGDQDMLIVNYLPGIRRLNRVRNRLAHTLTGDVLESDSEVFLSCQVFVSMHRASGRQLSDDPLVVLEEFARAAGGYLRSYVSPHANLWAEAIRRAHDEQKG